MIPLLCVAENTSLLHAVKLFSASSGFPHTFCVCQKKRLHMTLQCFVGWDGCDYSTSTGIFVFKRQNVRSGSMISEGGHNPNQFD